MEFELEFISLSIDPLHGQDHIDIEIVKYIKSIQDPIIN
jgi:hypothetical protein